MSLCLCHQQGPQWAPSGALGRKARGGDRDQVLQGEAMKLSNGLHSGAWGPVEVSRSWGDQ